MEFIEVCDLESANFVFFFRKQLVTKLNSACSRDFILFKFGKFSDKGDWGNMDSSFDSNFTKDLQLVDESELPPVAGHVAVEYRNTMIVWGGYVSSLYNFIYDNH